MITLSNKHDDCNKSVDKNCDQCVFGIYYTIMIYHILNGIWYNLEKNEKKG